MKQNQPTVSLTNQLFCFMEHPSDDYGFSWGFFRVFFSWIHL